MLQHAWPGLTTNASFTLVVTMWIISKQNVVAPNRILTLTGGHEDLTLCLLKALLISTTHSKPTYVNRKSSILLYLSLVLLSAADYAYSHSHSNRMPSAVIAAAYGYINHV